MATYTQVAGKRPKQWLCGDAKSMVYEWGYSTENVDFPSQNLPEISLLPDEVFNRLEALESVGNEWGTSWMFPSEAAALVAADEAYLKAVADRTMNPIEGVS